jgi:hypothetical protein
LPMDRLSARPGIHVDRQKTRIEGWL